MRMKRKIFSLIFYSISMAYLEAMVVIYLRKLVPEEIWAKVTSYKDLCNLIKESGIMWSEQTREFATIVMLVCVSFIFGENRKEKIASFLISFGLWDIFYYIFLYVWLKWPKNLFVWDVLFLIPSPWISPVIIPVLISFIMISVGFYILKGEIWKKN